jgi:hypothetical protein
MAEALVEFGADPEEALQFVLSYVRNKDYETAPLDDPEGAGRGREGRALCGVPVLVGKGDPAHSTETTG